MDDSRFDTLARTLGTAGSRRRALGGLLAGTLGILGWNGGDESAAHDLKAKCRKESGEAKKKCLKKVKKHKAEHAAETSGSSGSSGPSGPVTTCSDNVKNGTESDVDCGGNCPRCPHGGTCDNADDCETAFCAGTVCAQCAQDFTDCDPLLNGRCSCRSPTNATGRYCLNAQTESIINDPLCGGSCPAGSYCAQFSGTQWACQRLCPAGNLARGDRCGRNDDEECASGQCGCADQFNPSTCTCRSATCGGTGATCTSANGNFDCCDGRCVAFSDARGNVRHECVNP
jgi:hypothetical protein